MQISIIKKGILLFAVLFLLSSIYLASSWGKAYVSVIQPRQLMQKWSAKKLPFSEKHWKSAEAILLNVIQNNPNNPQYVFDLARLYDWAAYQKPIWNKEARKHRVKSIALYHQALTLRPTWSKAWANLAMSKTLNLEFGDEVIMALSNAMTYGAWEPGVFKKILWISFSNWRGLPIELQQQVKQKIKETMNSKGQVPRYVSRMAKSFKWDLKQIN